MNLKKTLGSILLAATLVTAGFAGAKPVQAATSTASVNPTGFSYAYPEYSMSVVGVPNGYCVSTNTTGDVQYELWARKASDTTWTVASKNSAGVVGYTDPVQGNAQYVVPMTNYTFDKAGTYYIAVYAKKAGTEGTLSYNKKIDNTGKEVSTGTEQKFDVVTSDRYVANDASAVAKFNRMDGQPQWSATTLTAGQTVTFKGFSGQVSGAKYKMVVRKFGDAYVEPTGAYASTINWTPAAGSYQLIFWSEPVNTKGARDGWRIMNVTVSDNGYATLLKDATDKVNAYSALAKGNLSTQDAITAANSAKALIKLDGLTDADKATLQAIITVADKAVADAAGKLTTTGTVTISTAVSPVMSSIQDVTITTSINNAVSFKLGDFAVTKLGSAARTFAASNPIAITLYAADGTTVVATGTIDTTKTTGTVTLAAAPVPTKIAATATVATSPVMSSIKDITVTVTGATNAKFQIEGFAMTASGSAARTFAAPAVANITIYAADGTTVLATGTIDTTSGIITLK